MKELNRKILNILNSEDSLESKRSALRCLMPHRRKESKRLLHTVINLLSMHILPVSAYSSFSERLLNSLIEPDYENLQQILDKTNCVFFNATCGELLWLHYKDKAFADLSMHSYYRELQSPSYEYSFHFAQASISICRIYSRCKLPSFPFVDFFDLCSSFVDNHLYDSGFGAVHVLLGLSICEYEIERLERPLTLAFNKMETDGNFPQQIIFGDALLSFYSITKQKSKCPIVYRRIAEAKEKLADSYDQNNPAQAHRIVHLIQEAMEYWQRSNLPEANTERKRLARRIEPVKKLALKGMQLIQTGPIDLRDAMDRIKKSVDSSTFEQVIWNIAWLLPLQSEQSILDEARKSKSFADDLFPTAMVDSEGRKRYILPTLSNASKDDLRHICEHHAAEKYKIYADAILKRYIWIAKERFQFTEESLAFLVNDNGFIPSNRRRSFLKGLVAGFNLDLLYAIPVLMPQIENAVRELAMKCGAVVYKTNACGVEECLSMESVLNCSELQECMDENVLFNLKVFYTSTYGLGMRNQSGHGLESDSGLQSPAGLASWWFALHLCCIFSGEMSKRLLKQHENENSDSCNIS